MSKCQQCNKEFDALNYTTECDQCDDGIAENERNPFMYEAFAGCRKCGGTGELKMSRTDFCSEDCIDEYFGNEYAKC